MRIILLFFILMIDLFGKEQLIIANFENLNSYYYNNQIVHFKLKILTGVNGNLSLKDDINRSYSIQDMNGTYISNIVFQLKDRFPTFIIDLNNSGVLEELNITPKSKVKILHSPKNFCGVLGSKLTITDMMLTNYDKHYNILYFNLSSDGNIKDFKLNFTDEKLFQNIENNSSIYGYSALVPLNQTDFNIKYFDLKSERYKTISFSLSLKNDTVSTQTDIRPMAKSNILIIDSVLAVIMILWAVLFYYRRKKIYIILILLVVLSLVFLNLPKKEIYLQEGTKIHILPFEKSTIFLVLEIGEKVKILDIQNGYKKIELHKHIGWVKDE